MRVPHTRSCQVRRPASNHTYQKPQPRIASDTIASANRSIAVRAPMRAPSSRASLSFHARMPMVAPTRVHDTTKYAPATASSHALSSARSAGCGCRGSYTPWKASTHSTPAIIHNPNSGNRSYTMLAKRRHRGAGLAGAVEAAVDMAGLRRKGVRASIAR